jgi:hypothetical protein
MKAAIFAVALLAASPALADHDTDRQRWVKLWKNCVASYVEAYPGHCANIVSRGEQNRLVREGGRHFHRQRDHRHTERATRQWCWNNPAYCADCEPRHCQ